MQIIFECQSCGEELEMTIQKTKRMDEITISIHGCKACANRITEAWEEQLKDVESNYQTLQANMTEKEQEINELLETNDKLKDEIQEMKIMFEDIKESDDNNPKEIDP